MVSPDGSSKVLRSILAASSFMRSAWEMMMTRFRRSEVVMGASLLISRMLFTLMTFAFGMTMRW
jgi:hypothetical protein